MVNVEVSVPDSMVNNGALAVSQVKGELVAKANWPCPTVVLAPANVIADEVAYVPVSDVVPISKFPKLEVMYQCLAFVEALESVRMSCGLKP